MNYKNKYLKYKLKYLTAKKLYGGMNPGQYYSPDTPPHPPYPHPPPPPPPEKPKESPKEFASEFPAPLRVGVVEKPNFDKSATKQNTKRREIEFAKEQPPTLEKVEKAEEAEER